MFFFTYDQSDDGKASAAYPDVGRRLAILSEHIGWPKSAEISGKSERQMKRYASGAEPPFGVLNALVQHTDVSFDWLASGRARTDLDYQLDQLLHEAIAGEIRELLLTNLSDGEKEDLEELLLIEEGQADACRQLLAVRARAGKDRGGQPRQAASDDLAGIEASIFGGGASLAHTDFVRLPLFEDVYASAGPGIIATSERANNVVAFERGFLRARGGNPEECSIIFARGTSMKPTIPDGSILVVDQSQRDVAHGCIYVFSVGEQLLVKRARWRMDGRLELVSDNSDEGYPVETFGPEAVDELRVVGRVIYFCRTP